MEEHEKSSALSSVPESQPFSGSILNHWDTPSTCSTHSTPTIRRLVKALCFFSLQQLYQTLTDYDIRFYMYEILKVSFSWSSCLRSPPLPVHIFSSQKKMSFLARPCSYEACASVSSVNSVFCYVGSVVLSACLQILWDGVIDFDHQITEPLSAAPCVGPGLLPQHGHHAQRREATQCDD